MWRNPKYALSADAPKPPEENGKRVATFDRGNGREMRVSIAEFNGHPYVSLRLWEPGQSGDLFPTKSGTSIRLSEVVELCRALSGLNTEPARTDPTAETAYREKRPARVHTDFNTLPRGKRTQRGFDEF